jgi:exonuclease V
LRLTDREDVPSSKRPLNTPPSTPRKAKRGRSVPLSPTNPSSTQTTLSRFYASEATPTVQSTSDTQSQFVLRLLDNKTRKANNFPPHNDTFGSRIQVMLYRRLLNNLMSTAEPFDFPGFWSRLGLRPDKSLSKGFLKEAQLPDTFTVKCLNDMTRLWTNTLAASSILEVDSVLNLVYRRRRTGSKSQKQRSASDIERLDIAKAIAASLKSDATPSTSVSPDEASASDNESKCTSNDDPSTSSNNS